jgi:hypothetical protein
MDGRDIKEKVPVITDGRYLENIYDLQKELINHYIEIEHLPNYPINVNPKSSQVMIKDFTARVIEELAEGYESMVLIDELSKKNYVWFHNYSTDDLSQAINHLQNISEEMADAMHFMIELMIYVNIQPEDIIKYFRISRQDIYNQYYEKNENDIIQTLMYIGGAEEVSNNHIYQEDIVQTVNILDKYLKVFSDDIDIDNFDIEFHRAGSEYGSSTYINFKKALWDVCYHLNIARNFLKNKPWKQSEMMTDEVRFQKELVEGFISLMGCYSILGLDSKTLFHIYFKKNRVNLFRIRSKY